MPERTYTVSQQEIERLRKQLGDLQRNPEKEPVHTQALIESMDRLYEALSRMIVILENANRAVAQDALQGIKDEHVKLDRLLEQNEKLARAVVALADEVRGQRRAPPPGMPRAGSSMPVPLVAPLHPAAIQPVPPMMGASSPGGMVPVAPMQAAAGHDETSFLAQPVMAPAMQQGLPSFVPEVPQTQPRMPSPVPQAPLPPMPLVPPAGLAVPPPALPSGAPGALPPLPPLPVLPPAAGGSEASGQKRPILKSFA